jgi:DNA-binding NarL/FixJ family response regulator
MGYTPRLRFGLVSFACALSITTTAETLAEAKGQFKQRVFDAILLDLSLPDSRGLETIGRFVEVAPSAPIVVLTGVADEAVAMEAVRCGAQDYLLKGQADGAMIARAIRYAIDRQQAEAAILSQRQELEAKNKELQETQRRLEVYRNRRHDPTEGNRLAPRRCSHGRRTITHLARR